MNKTTFNIAIIIAAILLSLSLSSVIDLKNDTLSLETKLNILKTSNLNYSFQKLKSDSEIKQLKKDNAELMIKLVNKYVVRAKTVVVSFYCPELGGINGSVGESASMTELKDGWSVAVSRDLVKYFYGMKIDLRGSNLPTKFWGIKYVADKMARTNPYTKEPITNQIDIFVSNPKMIPKEGVFKNVTAIAILPENYK